MDMDLRNFVTFEAQFPDDAVWNEAGKPLVPAGHGIAIAFQVRLKERGFKCSEPKQHKFYGWSFEALSERVCIWLLFQGGGPWLLIAEPKRSILAQFFGRGRGPDFEESLGILHEILRSDKRFSNARWFTRSEYERGKEGRASSSPS
jgi:hypothetical protein